MGQSGIRHNGLVIDRRRKMKKKPFFIWSLLTIAIFIYIGILLISIDSNNLKQEEEIFKEWYKYYVKQTPEGTFVNTSNDNQKPIALSESQGYGMLITILAAEKGYAKEADFKPFVTYYEHYQLSETNYLMEWKQEKKEEKWQSHDNNSATDGDLDIAYALFKASELWPNSKENYEEKALKLITSIQQETYNPKTKVLSVGNWATDSKVYWNLFRPSDVMPTYFEYFYKKTKDEFWLDLNEASLVLLEELSTDNQYGLLPDFAWIGKEKVTPAKANDIATDNDGDYAYNALRIPLRLTGSRNKSAERVNQKLLTFFSKEGQVRAGYNLKGEVLKDYPSVSYSAPLLLATQDVDEFSGLYAESRWIMYESINGTNYYGDSLKAIAVLQMK